MIHTRIVLVEMDWILEEWVLHQCQIQTVVKWTRLDEEEIRYQDT